MNGFFNEPKFFISFGKSFQILGDKNANGSVQLNLTHPEKKVCLVLALNTIGSFKGNTFLLRAGERPFMTLHNL